MGTEINGVRHNTMADDSPFAFQASRIEPKGQLRLTEIDYALLLARLMRIQTDLLVMAHDDQVPADARDKLRLAVEIVGEVQLRPVRRKGDAQL